MMFMFFALLAPHVHMVRVDHLPFLGGGGRRDRNEVPIPIPWCQQEVRY